MFFFCMIIVTHTFITPSIVNALMPDNRCFHHTLEKKAFSNHLPFDLPWKEKRPTHKVRTDMTFQNFTPSCNHLETGAGVRHERTLPIQCDQQQTHVAWALQQRSLALCFACRCPSLPALDFTSGCCSDTGSSLIFRIVPLRNTQSATAFQNHTSSPALSFNYFMIATVVVLLL